MKAFHYKNNELYVENVPLKQIAVQFGTPCYVYSKAALEHNWRLFAEALRSHPHRLCYAVKANSNIAILNILANLHSGFDIVSLGELERVLAAGGDPHKIIFSGVGKQNEEIARALQVDIFCFNVESENELIRINQIAQRYHKCAQIMLRINPNIDARTHPYIATGLHENKFGIEIENIFDLIAKIKLMPNVKLIGIGSHIGSQITELTPFLSTIDCLLEIINKIQKENILIKNINIGGGLGIPYQGENTPSIQDYVTSLLAKLKNSSLELILEPGRSIIAEAGILLTKVEYIKHSNHKNFAIVDAAMNDFMRAALYDAWQEIIPIILQNQLEEKIYDVVGPVCESGDFLGKHRKMTIAENDLLAVCAAGAYGFSMSSNYNSRPRAAEVLIDHDQIHLIRKRETIADLFKLEQIIER